MSITVPLLATVVSQTVGVVAGEGALTIVRKSLAPERPVGNLRFGGKRADVLLNITLGKPRDREMFEEEIIDIGGFNCLIFMKISGTWKKKISGGGVIVHVKCNIHGPFCPICNNKTKFTEKKRRFRKKWECSKCGREFPFSTPVKIQNKIAKGLHRLIPRALGLN